jgi:chromatin structure-remodeling complex protein RSC7
VDSTVTIKGKEYTVGDDELVLPDDPKGDIKVDAEGRLLGGE